MKGKGRGTSLAVGVFARQNERARLLASDSEKVRFNLGTILKAEWISERDFSVILLAMDLFM